MNAKLVTLGNNAKKVRLIELTSNVIAFADSQQFHDDYF